MVSDQSSVILKGTPDGDHHSKFSRNDPTQSPRRNWPRTFWTDHVGTSHPGTSILRANRLWNTTTINRKAPRMKFSQKELS